MLIINFSSVKDGTTALLKAANKGYNDVIEELLKFSPTLGILKVRAKEKFYRSVKERLEISLYLGTVVDLGIIHMVSCILERTYLQLFNTGDSWALVEVRRW